MAKASKALPQYIAGLSAGFGSFCLGATIGWSAPAEKMITEDIEYGFAVSTNQFGWISSLLTLGATCVCVPVGFLIDRIGRKPTMLALIPPYMIGWVLMIFAKNVAMLYCGRFILGVCGGAFCVTAPIYTTEISTLATRGMLGSFFQLLIVFGILYGYVVGAFVHLQLLNILCAILPMIFAAFFLFMPESPVYLALKGQKEAAAKSLAWLRGKHYDVDDELKQIMSGVEQSGSKTGIAAALKRPITLKGLGIAVLLQIFQQLTGINAIVFYSTSIFADVGAGLSASMSTILIGGTQVVMTLVAVNIIDKVGRRILLAISAFFMALTTALMGGYFQMRQNSEESVASLGWLPICSICMFIIFFAIGFGPVPWLIGAELFSEDVKAVAGSVAGTSNWLMAFAVTKLFPILQSSLGPAPTFWIFTVIAIMAFIYSLLWVPETKGKTLNEIQEMLGSKNS
ncbi:facilitated trehalose transporter Tret1-2 homolog [Scaptodrosophila lebanonensis]|uniref:Facilitated trehalose transporter Tret1-2 homolog n=1 Tax=Drosophila lebanonensis TaxID=7225 RepID=A0A6J2TY56_DROLE|nr:facilitated trehalose transporter Tret1-2 homolog [Scaptodrosophila lebanonensis]